MTSLLSMPWRWRVPRILAVNPAALRLPFPESERAAAVRFRAEETIAMPLDDAVLDHQVAEYTQTAEGTASMRVVVVAARRTMVEQLLTAVRVAGLKPEGIDLDAFALVRALDGAAGGAPGGETAAGQAGEGEPTQMARVLCHLGGVTNVAVSVGSTCVFARTLQAVWDDEDAGAALADQIRPSIDFYMGQPQALPVAEVLLSGPGSRDEQVVERIGAEIGLPVQVAEPLGDLDASALGTEEDPSRYTVAVLSALLRSAGRT